MGKSPVIIAVGGGKGGVGKSLISSGIATALAIKGRSTACVDLDLGGANLHTFFGLRTAERGIGDFIFHSDSRNLADYGIKCQVPNLTLIPGSGFIPGIANLYYFQKLKILRALKRLEFDFVVLDLGAGTSYNVIDFFSLTRSGIVVTNPEPTAILNAYEFIKNVLFRIFTRNFKQGHIALEIIEAHKFGENQQQGSSVRDLIEQLQQVDKKAAATVKGICQEFKPCLVLNTVRSLGHSKAIASNLIGICRNFLDIELRYLGAVPQDQVVCKELVKLKNVMIARPDSQAAKAISKLAERCISGFSGQELSIETENAGQECDSCQQNGFDSTGTEKGDIANMLQRFFMELGWDKDKSEIDYHGNGSKSKEEFAPLNLAEIGPRLEQGVLSPCFLKDVELNLKNFDVPDSLRQLLVFISELTHLEKDLTKKDNRGLLDVSASEVADAWFKTGLILIESGQLSTALRSFDRAFRLKDGFWQALNNIACCLMTLGQAEEALARLKEIDFKSSVVKGSFKDVINLNKVVCLFNLGRHMQALEILENLGKSTVESERISDLKAHCLYYLGKFKEASDTWRSDERPIARFNRAVALIKSKDYTGALHDLDLVIRHNKTDSQAYSLISLCRFALGQIEEAMESLERALVHEPFNVTLRAFMAFYSFKTGQMDRAIKEADIIARLRPSNPKLLKLVSEIRKELMS